MKMIKPAIEINRIPDAANHDEVLMFLEKIGRTCYKSEDLITETSCIRFIENIRNRKHWAILEHYIFTVSVPGWVFNDLTDILYHMSEDPKVLLQMGYIHPTYWATATDEKYRHLVSFSATAINNLMSSKEFVNSDCAGVTHLYRFMNDKYPELMYSCGETSEKYNPDIEFLTRDEIKALPEWLRQVHDFMSVKFTVDRGVTHEMVRHRPASFAQESTRYCNYSGGKFDGEITVIIPSFFDTGMGEQSNSLVFEEWKYLCEHAERAYKKLLEMGAKPEQARTVLPNSLKAEIVMTATLHEYNHFFAMRCSKAAHPQIREVACPLLSYANSAESYYEGMFEENMHLVTGEENN